MELDESAFPSDFAIFDFRFAITAWAIAGCLCGGCRRERSLRRRCPGRALTGICESGGQGAQEGRSQRGDGSQGRQAGEESQDAAERPPFGGGEGGRIRSRTIDGGELRVSDQFHARVLLHVPYYYGRAVSFKGTSGPGSLDSICIFS